MGYFLRIARGIPGKGGYPKTMEQNNPGTKSAEDRLDCIERAIHQEAFMTRMASTEAPGAALAIGVWGWEPSFCRRRSS